MLYEAKRTHVSDGLLGLIFCIPGFLDSVIHLTLDLDKVSFQLLLGVHQAGVLKGKDINIIQMIIGVN